jgi:hypothetical protein
MAHYLVLREVRAEAEETVEHRECKTQDNRMAAWVLMAGTWLILYIKMNVCFFVCLYVCMYETYTNLHFWTKLCTRLPLGLEETVGHVWTRNSWPLRPFGTFFFGGHCRIMGTRWLPARPFSAIPLYPWFQLVFVSRHRHYVVADGGVIRGSLISVILAGVPLTSRKWRRSRRRNHPPQRRIPYSGGCSRHVTDIMFNQATGPYATAPVSVTYRKSRSCRRELRVPTPSVMHCR